MNMGTDRRVRIADLVHGGVAATAPSISTAPVV